MPQKTFSSTLVRLSVVSFLVLISFLSNARTLYMAAGWSKPPYVIADKNSGFEIELIQQIFTQMGHNIEPLYVPFGRTTALVKSGEVDVGLTLNERHDINPAWLTSAYVGYQNIAATITERQINLNSISDLSLYSVIGFQSSSVLLGSEYADAVKDRDNYLELPDQSRQVQILMLGNIDVVVLDINIFSYFKSQLKPEYRQMQTTIHRLFPASAYRAAISDPLLRDQFNLILTQMLEDGRYAALLTKFGLMDVLGLTSQSVDGD